MNSPHVRFALAQKTLEFVPPLIRDTLLEDQDFRNKYGILENAILTFPDLDISFQRSSLYNAVRRVLSGATEKKVTNTKGQKWRLKNICKEGELPNLSLSRGEKRFPLSNLAALSPDRDTRLRFLDEAISDVNLPRNASDQWHNILSERALEDDEVDACLSEFRDTPVEKMRSISTDLRTAQISPSFLVPPSRRYFERLVGEYDESTSIRDYATSVGRTLFAQLSAWRPYDGFLFSLLLSSHASLTDEINVDQLSSEDLVSAYDFLERHGDRISQLGAIEVGLRVLPSRPEIEQPLIRLIEQIRDDDVDGQASGFKLLSALFCLVDGELSRNPSFVFGAAFLQTTSASRQKLCTLYIKGSAGISPFKGFSHSFVEKVNEIQERLPEVLDRSKAASFKQASHENRKPAFNLIEPRGVFRRINKAHPVGLIAEEVGTGLHRF